MLLKPDPGESAELPTIISQLVKILKEGQILGGDDIDFGYMKKILRKSACGS